MDGWSHVKSEPCSTLTFTHDISYIASIFFTFKNLCELHAHKNYVTGEIHPNSGKSMFCIQNSEDFDCMVVSLTLVQVNC